jgi:hypothetical protein
MYDVVKHTLQFRTIGYVYGIDVFMFQHGMYDIGFFL